MNYTEALSYIHNTPKFSRVLGNSLLSCLLDKLGNPHSELKFVHIAGTNGKGSTAAMLAKILTYSGYKTGLYTSPYIERFNERFRIDDLCISDNELAEITTEVKYCMEKNDCFVSEFALDTAIAFLYFKRHSCDIVVLETGLGGRLDATNVIDKSEASIITSISLDHTQYLGDTVEKIAYEKAGIIKPTCDLILYSDNKNTVCNIIKNVCIEKKAPFHIADKPIIKNGSLYLYNTEIKLSLNGDFQFYNAMTAVKTVEVLKSKGYNIENNSIFKALSDVIWNVRFEFLKNNLIIDGAHNPDALERLCTSLLKLKRPIHPVIAMMSDKAIDDCAEIILKYFKNVTVTQIDMPRCMSCEDIKSVFLRHGGIVTSCSDPYTAVKNSLSDDNTVCVMGSLYLAGIIRKFFH